MIEATFGSHQQQETGSPTHFQFPLKVLIANRNEEVLPLLAEAEAISSAGYWVALSIILSGIAV